MIHQRMQLFTFLSDQTYNFQGRLGLFINNYIGHLHLLLLTKHSLFSEVCGHGLPIGEGFCRTFLVLVSSPHLKPQVFPKREQGLHSLHSPTSQCTKTQLTSQWSHIAHAYSTAGGLTADVQYVRDWPVGMHSIESLGSNLSGQMWWHCPCRR